MPSAWQPIETAPKDETLLLWWDHNISVGHFASKGLLDPADVRQGVEWACVDWSPYADYAPPIINPTHWMPLPESPDAE